MVNNMFDIIKSYFSKEDYYIILTKKYLYIKNYSKIINIEEKEILIEIDSKIYKIKGDNMMLTKSISKDLAIKGSIESIDKI